MTIGRILVIEDEQDLAYLLELELCHEGYEVELSFDGRDGLTKIFSKPWDVVLLDVMLPQMNGLELCRKTRQDSQVPIMMLTARDAVPDRVLGLDYGADDYIVKPFAIEELLARIRVMMRRYQPAEALKKYSADTLTLYVQSREVEREGQKIQLTTREFDLLEFFLVNKNFVLTRDSILSKVWGYHFKGDTNLVDVYVRYLRGKIDDGFAKPLIHTVRGVGYVLKE